jgi:hypothetical protein
MSLPYYIERSKLKAKRPKKGEGVTYKHYDLFRGIQGGSSFAVKKVKTAEFKKWLIALHQPVESESEEEKQEAINQIIQQSQKVIEEGGADIKPIKALNMDSLVVDSLTVSHADNGELELKGLNILHDYLPEDTEAPARVARIAQEFITVVNKFHQECNSIAEQDTNLSSLCLTADTVRDESGKIIRYNWETAKLMHKKDGVYQEEYTEEWISANQATQTVFELQHQASDEFSHKLKSNKEAVQHTGEFFSEVLLRVKGKSQHIFNLISLNASEEATMVANEIIPHLETTNSLSKIA